MMIATIWLESWKSDLLSDVIAAHERIVAAKAIYDEALPRAEIQLDAKASVDCGVARARCQYLTTTELAAARSRQSS
jgi:hypothetical protein